MIVNRALVREVLETSVAVTFVILIVFVVVRSLGFLQQAVRGDVPVEAVLTLVVLKISSCRDWQHRSTGCPLARSASI